MLNGSKDCPEHFDLPDMLEELRNIARKTNEEWSSKLGIPASVAITCVN